MSTHRQVAAVLLVAAGAVVMPSGASVPARAAAPEVSVVRLPADALQPQVAIEEHGAIHVVYLKGAPARSDVFHAIVGADGRLAPPERVNAQAGAAIATGRVRGAHLAVDSGGAVHVSWLGSELTKAGTGGRTPVLYARRPAGASAFERERNVAAFTINADGGAVAAGRGGRVYVMWHGDGPSDRKVTEADRRVWMAESADGGRAFARERAISPAATGACGCCGLAALVDRAGALFAIYRGAREMVHRDALLLTSDDGARTFAAAPLEEWNVGACPMSTFSLVESTRGDLVAAWETAGAVAWARVTRDPRGNRVPTVVSPGPSSNRKYPVAVANARGETLFAWVEDTGWSKGGTIVWQRYDASGAPIGARERVPGLPVWGTVAAAARPDGGFVIVY